MRKIDWNEQFKIKIENIEPNKNKYEVVKLFIVMKLLYKYKKIRDWIKIYTNLELENNLIPDVYFENIKSKLITVYEIVQNNNSQNFKKKTEQYKDYYIYNFNSIKFIQIDLHNLSNNINEIYQQLDQYIF